jgi:hypothetical protein
MTTPPRREPAAAEHGHDVARMDDFELIRERQDVMAALASFTDRYRALNHEMSMRETLKWMTAPRTA